MSGEIKYRLGEATVVEPLVNRWEAWSHLLPPVPASLHLREYQLRLLRSYLEGPQAHADICANPKLRSGPFVDIPPARAAEVADLLRETEAQLGDNLRLAEDAIDFQNYLVREAKGLSLDSFYERLPETLRGYVELTYDYYNRPAVRFLEGLLYESPYYQKGLQSFRLFRQQKDGARPFIMSTPRLPEPGQIEWQVSFDDPAVDELFRLDAEPQPLSRIREILGLTPEDDDVLLPLLTAEPAPKREAWDGDRPRVRYFGHACALVEWKGVSILTDAYVGVTPLAGGIDRWSYDDLPERIDYVLITHNHHDHFCLETLLRLRHKLGCLVVPHSTRFFYGDLSLKLLAKKLGFRNVVELDGMESIEINDGEIVAIPFMGEHADLPHSKSAYVVRAGSDLMLFAADSDCLDERMYENVRRALGPVGTVFIGMECVGAPLSWSCGPFFPVKPSHECEQNRRFKGADSLRAQKMLAALEAENLYIYAMGMEPWFEHMLGLGYTEDSVQLLESNNLLAVARESGFRTAERLFGKRELIVPANGREEETAANIYEPATFDEEVAEFVFE